MAVYRCGSAYFPYRRASTNDLHLEAELVSRHDRPAKSKLIETGEKKRRSCGNASGALVREQGTCLC